MCCLFGYSVSNDNGDFFLHSKQAAEQEYEKEKQNERIAKLSGGVAVIQVIFLWNRLHLLNPAWEKERLPEYISIYTPFQVTGWNNNNNNNVEICY